MPLNIITSLRIRYNHSYYLPHFKKSLALNLFCLAGWFITNNKQKQHLNNLSDIYFGKMTDE